MIVALDEEIKTITQAGNPAGNEAFDLIKKDFNARKASLKKLVKKTDDELENIFTFAEDVFSDGQEMLIIVTELTKGFYSAHYISRYGCKKYFEHNKELLFYERQNEIIKEIENLDL